MTNISFEDTLISCIFFNTFTYIYILWMLASHWYAKANQSIVCKKYHYVKNFNSRKQAIY
jgi:hypothetical protein